MINPTIEKLAKSFLDASSPEEAREAFDIVKNLELQDQKTFVALTQDFIMESLDATIQEDYNGIWELLVNEPEMKKEFLGRMQLSVEFSKFAKTTHGETAPAVCHYIEQEVGALDDDQYNDPKQLLEALKRAGETPNPKRKNPFSK